MAHAVAYAGQYTDPATGLQYLRARYYDPATQQFLTVDPLLAQTAQAYAYAGGSPTNGSDPSGLHAVCVYGGGNFGWIFTATGALYTCSAVDDSTGDRDWGLLFVPGGVLSSAAGLAGNVGIFWSDAQNLDDLTGWAGDIGGALGFGKTLGVALDCYPSTNSQGRHITSWALGVTGGPNFSALGLVEVHGGAGYGILTPLRLRLAKDQPLSGDGVTTTGNHTPPNLGSSGGGGIPFGERHDPSDPMSSEHYRK